jgi:KDO2-lipid IV(A) lauroyltransferase
VYIVLRLVLCTVQALPLDLCARAARWLSWFAVDVLRMRHQLVEENLTHAFPHLSAAERYQIERRMWDHLFLMVAEVVHAPRKIHDTNWRDHIVIDNKREIVRHLLSDRPTVFVSGHYGNFELSSFVLGLLGFPGHSIARPLDNRYLDRAVNQFRGMYGQHILPKEGAALPVDAVLQSGGTLALLADQHAGPKGLWLDFFGRPASTHKAIGLFSLGSDAPLIMSYVRRLDKPLRHVVAGYAVADPRSGRPEVANVRALTEWYTHRLEEIVRADPTQYWWLHRRWREPKPRGGASKAA